VRHHRSVADSAEEVLLGAVKEVQPRVI